MATQKVWVFNGTQLEEFSPTGETIAITDVQGLVNALAGKSPLGHTHSIADLPGVQAAIDAAVAAATSAAFDPGDVFFIKKDPATGFWPASWSGKTPVYTGGSASAGVRPTSLATVMCIWIGSDPPPAIVTSGTGGMRDGVDENWVR